MENILETVQEIFRDILDEESLILKTDTTADDVEEWDSLNHINLISAIEKKFKIRFALGELQSLKNVGSMVELIDSKL